MTGNQAAPLQISVASVNQLFSTLDPSPFYEKDLDPDAEEYLVSWAQELPHDSSLSLVIHLLQPSQDPAIVHWVPQAIARHFSERAQIAELEFRRLMRQGRISLAIGLAAMATFLLIAHWLVASSSGVLAGLLRESFTVAGWVAMWRPMQIYLYDWWPLHGRVRLFRRLGSMPVTIKETTPRG